MDGMLERGGWLGDGREGGRRVCAQRRRWAEARKAAIVAESFVAGVKVSDVAARHGVNANLLSTWRGQVSARVKSARSASNDAPMSASPPFVPVKVVTSARQSDVQTAVGAIEIVLGDVSIRVTSGVDAATLSRVLTAVRGRGR